MYVKPDNMLPALIAVAASAVILGTTDIDAIVQKRLQSICKAD